MNRISLIHQGKWMAPPLRANDIIEAKAESPLKLLNLSPINHFDSSNLFSNWKHFIDKILKSKIVNHS